MIEVEYWEKSLSKMQEWIELEIQILEIKHDSLQLKFLVGNWEWSMLLKNIQEL